MIGDKQNRISGRWKYRYFHSHQRGMVIARSNVTEGNSKRNERPNKSYVKTKVLDLFKREAKMCIRLKRRKGEDLKVTTVARPAGNDR